MASALKIQWLNEQINGLSKTQPVLLMSHQPIVYYQALFKGMGQRAEEIIKPLHKTSRRAMFISGHIHELDALQFHNLAFHCNGALAGRWWRAGPEKDGSLRGTPMGYALLELYPDGQSTCTYYDMTDWPTTQGLKATDE